MALGFGFWGFRVSVLGSVVGLILGRKKRPEMEHGVRFVHVPPFNNTLKTSKMKMGQK